VGRKGAGVRRAEVGGGKTDGSDPGGPARPLIAHKLDSERTDGLVFGTGKPFASSAVRRRALIAWRNAKLTPIGLQEARHSFASLMIAAGVNAKALSVYMGHASVTITLDRYGHLGHHTLWIGARCRPLPDRAGAGARSAWPVWNRQASLAWASVLSLSSQVEAGTPTDWLAMARIAC